MNKQWIRLAGGVATVALLAVGCSMSPSMTHAMPGSMAGTATSATKAADLRTGLNALLGEHVAFLSSANPTLPRTVVADLVKTHVLTLKDVVDAQAAGDPVKANKALRTAYSHMHMIADPLAEAIVKQFSSKYAAQ